VVRCAVDLIFIRYYTMGAIIRVPDSPFSGPDFSKFSIATHLRFCSKVVDQGFSYNFATVAIAKFPLDQS
jgi:hypothetical protein